MIVPNFGMDLRPSSQVIKTGQEYQNEQDAWLRQLQDRQTALTQSAQSAQRRYGQARVDQARAQGFNVSDSYADLTTKVAARPGWGASYVLDPNNFTFDIGDAARGAAQKWSQAEAGLAKLGTERTQGVQNFEDSMAARTAAEQTQQNAYNTNLGGTPGGVLASTAMTGAMDPTQPTSTMPWNQPWMSPGYGNPGGLGGLGGYDPNKWMQGGPQGQSQAPTGSMPNTSGWGGIFANKNPWSPA